jgi:hypothetical protein
MDLLIDSQYFPNLSYFKEIYNSNKLIINDKELFDKQTYRNRCRILGANGAMDLIAPVNHSSPRKMANIELSYTDRWASVHLRSIESAYRRSPFFEYYAADFFAILEQKPTRLIDLNTKILKQCLKILSIEKPILMLSECDFNSEEVKNLTGKIHPKKESLVHSFNSYQQVFSHQFTPNLSILDTIFCLGKETVLHLES